MRPLFDEFINLWPVERRGIIQYFLKDIFVIRIPEDRDEIMRAPRETTIVVLDQNLPETNPMEFFMAGYEHVLCSFREDFANELFASCLMLTRPQKFRDNPIPFFFSGFSPQDDDPILSKNFSRKFDSSSDKPYLINELDYFLSQEPELKGIKDICLQSADEIISNAVYNAPITSFGEYLYKNTPRDTPVQFPFKTYATLFASYNSEKVVIGCEDPFGSIQRGPALERLSQVYFQGQVAPQMTSAGTGLGFKFIVENCSSFYLYCESRKKSLVACSFRLLGKRKNTSKDKHIHFSIR